MQHLLSSCYCPLSAVELALCEAAKQGYPNPNPNPNPNLTLTLTLTLTLALALALAHAQAQLLEAQLAGCTAPNVLADALGMLGVL